MLPVQKLNLNIGGYDVLPVPTGQFGLDGGAMFGTVPKVLWEKTNPSDDKNRIAMEARALLLRGNGKNILVDCGIGGDFMEKYGPKLGAMFQDIYAVNDSGASLEKSLNKCGLSFADITDVILTHLHFDHAGGATTVHNGMLEPTFQNAKYYIQRRNLETARTPNLREKASYFAANFEPLLKANCLQILDGPVTDILPGISVMVTDGHTVGQQVVKVSDSKKSLLYCADLIPTSTHVRLPWIMGYDLNPLLLIEEKNNVLGPAADEGWYLYFEHDPYCDAGTVERNQHDFKLKERVALA
jgi:glyoxylase-like metal-dependent hydrolase (beta-lactamase superfamily II)